ncbi:MAG: VanW family protein [Clostridia bacterium]|nr:VanW family protein [Clostridia bacterium]
MSCGFFSTIFALIYSTNSNIINNIKINNIKVSGLSRSEAEAKFENIIENITQEEFILKHGENEKTFTFKRMELETDIIEKINKACKIGREGNIITNNYQILATLINGENIELDIKFNEEILQSIFSNLDDEWEETFVDNSYYIDNDKLVIVRGTKGIIVDEEALREELKKFVYDKIEGKEINKIEIPVITKTPGDIDIEKIQSEIYKEAQNASYDEKTSKLTIHSDGIDLGISIDEAKQRLLVEQEEYIIPIKITKPEITTDMLGEDAFPDVIASFSTRYDSHNINRATNIDLAAKTIDGTILAPGERFSFNSIVGPTTASKGYLLAGAYSAGELVENYGGGICQVSSTIYNTVLYANLEIVERYNHSSLVSYVDPGRDATISYGSKDFKFLNSRKYAIKINARATNRSIRSRNTWNTRR